MFHTPLSSFCIYESSLLQYILLTIHSSLVHAPHSSFFSFNFSVSFSLSLDLSLFTALNLRVSLHSSNLDIHQFTVYSLEFLHFTSSSSLPSSHVFFFILHFSLLNIHFSLLHTDAVKSSFLTVTFYSPLYNASLLTFRTPGFSLFTNNCSILTHYFVRNRSQPSVT